MTAAIAEISNLSAGAHGPIEQRAGAAAEPGAFQVFMASLIRRHKVESTLSYPHQLWHDRTAARVDMRERQRRCPGGAPYGHDRIMATSG